MPYSLRQVCGFFYVPQDYEHWRKGKERYLSVKSFLHWSPNIGDTVKWNSQLTKVKSNVGFWGERKTGVPGEKPLAANTPNPHKTPSLGIEPSENPDNIADCASPAAPKIKQAF